MSQGVSNASWQKFRGREANIVRSGLEGFVGGVAGGAFFGTISGLSSVRSAAKASKITHPKPTYSNETAGKAAGKVGTVEGGSLRNVEIIDESFNVIPNNVVNGEVSVPRTINIEKQGRHIIGSGRYVQGRSTLTENAQSLLDDFLSGKVNSFQSINADKIRVDFGKPIGYYSQPGSMPVQSNIGILVISKTGVHIYPASPTYFK